MAVVIHKQQFRGMRCPAGKLIVELAKPEEISAGGIVLPDQAKRPRGIGVVRCTPPDAPEGIGVGDIVVFSLIAATEFQDIHSGDSRMNVALEDVLAVYPCVPAATAKSRKQQGDKHE